VFEQQPAARREVARAARDDDAQRRQAVRMVGQRADRLEAQIALGQVLVAGRDVRRVRGDQVERVEGGQRVEPVAVQEAHARAVGGGIRLRDGQRVRADVQRGDVGVRPRVRDGDGDRAAAGAHVEQARALSGRRQALERQFDDQFCVRPGNQHGGADLEIEAEEFALGRRCRRSVRRAGGAPPDHRGARLRPA
jgi:hypothetical protein